jgi:hypothetical protein
VVLRVPELPYVPELHGSCKLGARKSPQDVEKEATDYDTGPERAYVARRYDNRGVEMVFHAGSLISDGRPEQAEHCDMSENNLRNNQMPLSPYEDCEVGSHSSQTSRKQELRGYHEARSSYRSSKNHQECDLPVKDLSRAAWRVQKSAIPSIQHREKL